MLQEKKVMIASRLRKTMDTSTNILRDINEGLERVIRDNKRMVTLSEVFKTWVEKVSNT